MSLLASVAALLASGGFLATMLRHRANPTTRPLTGLAAALLVAATLHLATVDIEPVRAALALQGAPTDSASGLWILLAFDLAAVVGGLWFLFAIQYTGRGERMSRVATAVVAALLVALATASAALAASSPDLGISADSLNLLLGVTLVLGEGVALLGVFLVITATVQTKAIPARQTALLTLGVGVILVVPFVATTFQTPIATAVAIAAASLVLTAAVSRYRVFETLPAATVVGRDRVIDEMSEGVLVVDTAGRVRDCNPVAQTMFSVDRSVIGEHLEETLPSLARADTIGAVGAAASPHDVELDSGTVVSVSTDSVTDTRGRSLGRLLVCRDVTDERARENRLALLTLLAAGGTQRQMTDVAATARDVADGERDPGPAGDAIHETASTVAALVARVRDVERALADDTPETAATTDAVDVVRDLQAPADLAVSTKTGSQQMPVTGSPALLQATLAALLTGAATSADAATLRVRRDDDRVVFRIAPFDAGAAGSVPDQTLQVAKLAADNADWTVRATCDAGEHAVTVVVPRADVTRGESSGGASS